MIYIFDRERNDIMDNRNMTWQEIASMHDSVSFLYWMGLILLKTVIG